MEYRMSLLHYYLAMQNVIANIGFNAQFDDIAEVPISEYKAVPMDARKALAQSGVRSLGEFQKLGAERVAELLSNSGVKVTPATAARWSGEAMVVGKVAGRAR